MTVTRRSALQILAAGSLAAQRRGPTRKPNFIVILADDLGCGDIACFGGKDVSTPNIDSIAAAGAHSGEVGHPFRWKWASQEEPAAGVRTS